MGRQGVTNLIHALNIACIAMQFKMLGLQLQAHELHRAGSHLILQGLVQGLPARMLALNLSQMGRLQLLFLLRQLVFLDLAPQRLLRCQLRLQTAERLL